MTKISQLVELASEAVRAPADFAPLISMRLDIVTDNLIMTGEYAGVSLSFAWSHHVSLVELPKMFAKLRNSLWQAQNMSPDQMELTFGLRANKNAEAVIKAIGY